MTNQFYKGNMVQQRPMTERTKSEQTKLAMKWWNNLPRQERNALKTDSSLTGADKIREYWLKNIVR